MRPLVILCLAAAPAAASPCRALINLAPTDAPDARHVVADVRLDGTPSARVVPGLAIGKGKAITQLRVVRDGGYAPGMDARFAALVAMDPVTGTETKWLGGRQELERPMPGEQGAAWNFDGSMEVAGVFGDAVSVNASTYGYTGGAHDFDDRSLVTVRAPKGEAVNLATWLGADFRAAVSVAIETERATREDGWPDGPQATDKSLGAGMVSLKGNQLAVDLAIDCCSWAENHGYHDLTVTVPAPGEARGLVPDDQGWFEGGCGAFRVDTDGRLFVKRDAEQPAAVLPRGRVLGVAWVDADAPALRVRKPDEAARKAGLARAREVVGKAEWATVAALLEGALGAVPGHPERLGELGFVAFKAGRLADAEALTRAALEGVTDAALDGRLRFNLALVALARGQLLRARRLLASSLARRPDPTVKKRLAEVEARLVP
ncbi:MAG: hypothetical protein KC549_04450 [Myxococcales bacterium]|nr:hypothetical protein [Myxococcales bacterium]